MKNPFKKSTAATDIEAEVARMKAKRADAERRLELAGQDLAEAKAARLETLDGDDAAIEAATDKIRAAQSAVSETEELIGDFDHAIAGAEQRLVAAKDREIRETEAKRIDAAAAAVEKRKADLVKTVNALAAVIKGIAADVPEDIPLWGGEYLYRPDGRDVRKHSGVSAKEAVAGIVADALAAAVPGIADNWRDGGKNRSGILRWLEPEAMHPTLGSYEAMTSPLPAAESLDALIVSRLRKRAADIRGGEIAPGEGKIVPPAPPKPQKEEPPEVQVFVKRSFSYVKGFNPVWPPMLELVGAEWVRWVPEPVAREAVSRGFALRTDDPKGAAAFEAEKERRERPNFGYRVGPLTAEQCVPLGDILGLEQEWREEHAPLHSEEAEEAARAVG